MHNASLNSTSTSTDAYSSPSTALSSHPFQRFTIPALELINSNLCFLCCWTRKLLCFVVSQEYSFRCYAHNSKDLLFISFFQKVWPKASNCLYASSDQSFPATESVSFIWKGIRLYWICQYLTSCAFVVSWFILSAVSFIAVTLLTLIVKRNAFCFVVIFPSWGQSDQLLIFLVFFPLFLFICDSFVDFSLTHVFEFWPLVFYKVPVFQFQTSY